MGSSIKNFENSVVESDRKYLVGVHGGLTRDTFRLPPGVVLVFLTYPGACLNPSRFMWDFDDDEAKKYLLGTHRGYSVTYLPGDLVSDYLLYFHGPTGVAKINKNRTHRIMNLKGPDGHPLKRFLPTLVESLPRGPKHLVLFMVMCRGTSDDEAYKRCSNMNERACTRMGITPRSRDITDTRAASVKHFNENFDESNEFPNYKKPTLENYPSLSKKRVASRLGYFDPRAALRVLVRRRLFG